MRRYLIAALAAVALCLPFAARAADFTVTWNCYVLDGSLSEDAYDTFSGVIQIGPDRIFDTTVNFVLPNAFVGNGTGRSIGSIVMVCDVFADPRGPAIHDIRVDLLGQLVPGEKALNPYIAWTELIKDISDANNPTILVSDSGVDYVQPTSRHYVFDRPTHAIRIKETFVLSGVTYTDENGRTLIDETALAALTLVEKELSFVPEPSQIAGLGMALATLTAVLRRRRK
ncbi:MAG: PEP-CTERM sorting domain-containing protein [Fimbriimonadia bacterium]